MLQPWNGWSVQMRRAFGPEGAGCIAGTKQKNKEENDDGTA